MLLVILRILNADNHSDYWLSTRSGSKKHYFDNPEPLVHFSFSNFEKSNVVQLDFMTGLTR